MFREEIKKDLEKKDLELVELSSINKALNIAIKACFVVILMKVGDLQSSFSAVNRSLEAFPEHWDSKDLLRQLRLELAAL